MTKLTDTQLIVLSKAAQREDGAALVPKGLSKAPAAKVAASLISRKLMREVRTKVGMPVWRTGDEGREYSLVILKAGREAIGVDDAVYDVSTSASPKVGAKKQATLKMPTKERTAALPVLVSAPASAKPRDGSKQAQVIAMLSRAEGATIDELVAATEWLPHTTRAVLTGLRKRGYELDRERNDGVTRYKIKASPKAVRAA